MSIKKIHNYIIIGTLLLLSNCNNKEVSEIEDITYDQALVKEIQSNYDSTRIEYPRRNDFWTIEYFIKDSILENKLMRDSIGNIVGIVRSKNGLTYFNQEYYPNRQLRGKTNFPIGKIDGSAIYKSKGQWKDFKQVGKWKNYKENGQLKTIEIYNRNGELELTE